MKKSQLSRIAQFKKFIKKPHTAEEINFFLYDMARNIDEEYAREDVLNWFQDNGIRKPKKALVDKVLSRYLSHADSNYGVWDNIAAAYDYYEYVR